MERVQLEAEIRNKFQKGFCKQLRREGKFPAVVYGLKKEPLPLTLDYNEFVKVRRKTKGEASFIDLSVSKTEGIVKKSTIVKSIQIHPVTGKVLHVDFLEITMTEKTVFPVSLVFLNESVATKKEDGVLEHTMRKVYVKALLEDVPNHIEIDLAGLEPGKAFHVRDLIALVSDKVEIQDDGNKVVVALLHRSGKKTEAGEESPEEGST